MDHQLDFALAFAF